MRQILFVRVGVVEELGGIESRCCDVKKLKLNKRDVFLGYCDKMDYILEFQIEIYYDKMQQVCGENVKSLVYRKVRWCKNFRVFF